MGADSLVVGGGPARTGLDRLMAGFRTGSTGHLSCKDRHGPALSYLRAECKWGNKKHTTESHRTSLSVYCFLSPGTPESHVRRQAGPCRSVAIENVCPPAETFGPAAGPQAGPCRPHAGPNPATLTSTPEETP